MDKLISPSIRETDREIIADIKAGIPLELVAKNHNRSMDMVRGLYRRMSHSANSKFLDYDGDCVVLQVGEQVGVIGPSHTLLTALSGNHSTQITLNDEDLDALIKGLKKARKAKRT